MSGGAIGLQQRCQGLLLGGAIGDALGGPVEFIVAPAALDAALGMVAPEHLIPPYPAAVTDDTQMTFWTVDAILRVRGAATPTAASWGSAEEVTDATYEAYLRWLGTQGEQIDDDLKTGSLWSEERLHARRAPGLTCLGALASGRRGTVADRINNSMGCGGVMRTAPIGLVFDPRTAYLVGCDNAALTHGHDNGIAPAGAMAAIVAALVGGADLRTAVTQAIARMREDDWAHQSADLLETAAAQAAVARNRDELTALLGEGWVGHEALAIAVAAALTFTDDPASAIWAAANHRGDSDSTASLTGQLLGALHGLGALPDLWVDEVEMADVALSLADELIALAPVS